MKPFHSPPLIKGTSHIISLSFSLAVDALRGDVSLLCGKERQTRLTSEKSSAGSGCLLLSAIESLPLTLMENLHTTRLGLRRQAPLWIPSCNVFYECVSVFTVKFPQVSSSCWKRNKMFSCSINRAGHGSQFAEQCGANKTSLDSHVGRFISASCRGDL